jgi:hypothetical protein
MMGQARSRRAFLDMVGGIGAAARALASPESARGYKAGRIGEVFKVHLSYEQRG